jgi:sialic acid synthase
MKTIKIIAEIGCIHIGNLSRAKKLAKLAKIAGADVLKTQKRNPHLSVKRELWDQPHPNKMFAYGNTYLEHRVNCELSIEEHSELKKYCEDINIEYSTSVWDIDSAQQIIELNPKFIKIPSACNNDIDLLNLLLNNYNGDIHISFGMSTKQEREKIYNLLIPIKNRIVAYHCTSEYPVPFERLYLKEISNLCELFPRVGFSNHGFGIATEIAAYTLGCTYFERHFCDDRCFPHTDAAASLEPQGLSKLVRDLYAIEKSLKNKPDKLTDIELEQRNKLRSN